MPALLAWYQYTVWKSSILCHLLPHSVFSGNVIARPVDAPYPEALNRLELTDVKSEEALREI